MPGETELSEDELIQAVDRAVDAFLHAEGANEGLYLRGFVLVAEVDDLEDLDNWRYPIILRRHCSPWQAVALAHWAQRTMEVNHIDRPLFESEDDEEEEG